MEFVRKPMLKEFDQTVNRTLAASALTATGSALLRRASRAVRASMISELPEQVDLCILNIELSKTFKNQ